MNLIYLHSSISNLYQSLPNIIGDGITYGTYRWHMKGCLSLLIIINAIWLILFISNLTRNVVHNIKHKNDKRNIFQGDRFWIMTLAFIATDLTIGFVMLVQWVRMLL